jgi:hypothetical protein
MLRCCLLEASCWPAEVVVVSWKDAALLEFVETMGFEEE